MKAADLQLVREASERERGHAAELAAVRGKLPADAPPDDGRCYCTTCKEDRVTIADAAPYLIAYVHESQRQPRRGSGDFGDLD